MNKNISGGYKFLPKSSFSISRSRDDLLSFYSLPDFVVEEQEMIGSPYADKKKRSLHMN